MRILGACNHLGGVNALLPVLNELKRSGNTIFVLTNRSNRHIFRDREFRTQLFESPMTFTTAGEILERYEPTLILSGTSEPEDHGIGRLESIITACAKNQGRLCFSILDFWSRYKERFSLSKANSLDAQPDKIFVMDQLAKKHMLAAGFSDERLIVTGNPHWDQLETVHKTLDKSNKKQIRVKLGGRDSHRILLFLSQPLSTRDYKHLGYSEITVLEEILNMVRRDQALSDVEIWIKQHPSEDNEAVRRNVRRLSSRRITIIDDNVDVHRLGMISDFVIGMFSMLLVEYELLGIKTISYQPASDQRNIVPLGTCIPVIKNKNKLRMEIENWSNYEAPQFTAFNATQKVLSSITDIVGGVSS